MTPPRPPRPNASLLISYRRKVHASGGNLSLAAETLESVGAVSGTPAAASALAGLYMGMGDGEKAAGVVEQAVEAAYRGEHVS